MTGSDSSTDAFERGYALHRVGKLEQAAACYREALAEHDDDHRALHGLGLIALQTSALHAAKPLISNAVKVAPDVSDYRVSLGRVLQATGRPLEALESFRQALEIDALNYEARYRLAVLLHRTGELEKALQNYEMAAATRADDPALLVNFGALLNLLGRGEDAIPLYMNAIALRPDMAAAHGNLGNALAALGRHDEAIEAFERSLVLAPAQATVYANLGSCRLARGELSAARAAFETCLREAPGDITSLAMLAALYNEQGEANPAKALMDFENLMRYRRIEPPAHQDLAVCLSALRSYVLSHVTLRTDPGSHTTKLGQQTGSLLPSQDPVMQHLVGQIREGVSAYIAERPSQWRPVPVLPALWSPPQDFHIDMWATVLGDGGHQTPHIHPSGWLSGVFYVDIPSPKDDDSKSGWIEFGCLPQDVPLHARPLTHIHRPQAGELVLFPSYFFHRTLPLLEDKTRISIAFDIVPKTRR